MQELTIKESIHMKTILNWKEYIMGGAADKQLIVL